MPFGIGGSSSSSEQRIADIQEPYLLRLFQQGARQVPRSYGSIAQGLPGFQQQVLSPALAAFSGLASGASGQNPYLEQQISSGVNNLNENFFENIIPGLRRGATANAGFGASSGVRGQLAESNAVGELLDAQTNFESSLRGDAFNNQLASQLQALQLSPQLLNLFTGTSTAPFAPFLAQRRILGNPIVLGESSSSSGSFSFGDFG